MKNCITISFLCLFAFLLSCSKKDLKKNNKTEKPVSMLTFTSKKTFKKTSLTLGSDTSFFIEGAKFSVSTKNGSTLLEIIDNESLTANSSYIAYYNIHGDEYINDGTALASCPSDCISSSTPTGTYYLAESTTIEGSGANISYCPGPDDGSSLDLLFSTTTGYGVMHGIHSAKIEAHKVANPEYFDCWIENDPVLTVTKTYGLPD